MEYKQLHISYSATAIYQDFKNIEGYKTDLISHLVDVGSILVSVLKEPWKYDYPEHVDEFKKLKVFLIKELVKEIRFTKHLADRMCNLNEVIKILKKL